MAVHPPRFALGTGGRCRMSPGARALDWSVPEHLSQHNIGAKQEGEGDAFISFVRGMSWLLGNARVAQQGPWNSMERLR